MIHLFLRVRQTNLLRVLFKNRYAIHPAGIVVQLVRAPPCQGGSCGFEPRQSRTRVQWMEKFIFPFFHQEFPWKREGRGQYPISMDMENPYFSFFILQLSIKRELYRNFFLLLLVDKERHTYHNLNLLFDSYGIELGYFSGIHTQIVFVYC